MKLSVSGIKDVLKRYFSLLNDKEDEQQVIYQVSSSVTFRGTNLWILICAIFIASLGLNVNSTAVIIGAMLISPLMSPIIGMGLSVGIYDFDLLKRSLKNYLVATLISVLTATIYFLISPLSEAQSELLARTSPTLYDVLIAFFGGGAGVLALTTKNKGQVIPGVAIATALMPPLCTAGYGLATLQFHYFLGAFYLFFINSVFIALATFLGVKLLKFHPHHALSPEREQYGRRLIIIIVAITMIPAFFMTLNIIRRNVFDRNLQQFLRTELSTNGTQVLSSEVAGDTLKVALVGKYIDSDDLANIKSRMTYYNLGHYHLHIIQSGDYENSDNLSSIISNMESTYTANSQNLSRQIDLLQQQLDRYTLYDSLSLQINAEIVPLFSEIESLVVGRMPSSVVAIAKVKTGHSLPSHDEQRLHQWLLARTNTDTIDLIIR